MSFQIQIWERDRGLTISIQCLTQMKRETLYII